jgi:hypothetical protein
MLSQGDVVQSVIITPPPSALKDRQPDAVSVAPAVVIAPLAEAAPVKPPEMAAEKVVRVAEPEKLRPASDLMNRSTETLSNSMSEARTTASASAAAAAASIRPAPVQRKSGGGWFWMLLAALIGLGVGAGALIFAFERINL